MVTPVVINVKPKLSELSHELKGLTWSDVESVAVQLEVDYDELLKIQQQTAQATNRMHQAFNLWLKTDSDASWEKVISALKRVGGKDVLVQRLREKYLPQSPGNLPSITLMEHELTFIYLSHQVNNN